MPDTPWLGDACSLVDAFRSGARSPVDELEACLAAIDESEINAFCHLDVDAARERAATADVELPFGGVPIAVKELEPVAGWPYTEASLVFADRVADHDSTAVERLRAGGANLFGQTTASEFGGLNVSITKLHGVTGNAWDPTRTAGGSSGGSAAAGAAGLRPAPPPGGGGGGGWGSPPPPRPVGVGGGRGGRPPPGAPSPP